MGCGANSKVGNYSDDSDADLIRPGPSKKNPQRVIVKIHS